MPSAGECCARHFAVDSCNVTNTAGYDFVVCTLYLDPLRKPPTHHTRTDAEAVQYKWFHVALLHRFLRRKQCELLDQAHRSTQGCAVCTSARCCFPGNVAAPWHNGQAVFPMRWRTPQIWSAELLDFGGQIRNEGYFCAIARPGDGRFGRDRIRHVGPSRKSL